VAPTINAVAERQLGPDLIGGDVVEQQPRGQIVVDCPFILTRVQVGLIVLGRPFWLSCDQPRSTRRARSSSLVLPQRASPAIIGGASGVHVRAS
jgi:hypothetical protein